MLWNGEIHKRHGQPTVWLVLLLLAKAQFSKQYTRWLFVPGIVVYRDQPELIDVATPEYPSALEADQSLQVRLLAKFQPVPVQIRSRVVTTRVPSAA